MFGFNFINGMTRFGGLDDLWITLDNIQFFHGEIIDEIPL
jgi:hypothetical protein